LKGGKKGQHSSVSVGGKKLGKKKAINSGFGEPTTPPGLGQTAEDKKIRTEKVVSARPG